MPSEVIDLIKNEDVTRDIRAICLEFPWETCGIIIFNTEFQKPEVCKCNNIAKDPYNFFLIDRKEINEFTKKGEIIGYFHAHTKDSNLSTEDIAVMTKLNIPCIIYNRFEDSLSQTNPDPEFIPGLEGRPFIAGFLDCSELVKDYFKKTLNISLSSMEHPIKFMSWSEIKEHWDELQEYNNKDYNFLADYFISNGFYEISRRELQKHDVILCRAKEIEAPVHVLIFLGNGRILHHPSERPSVIEQYNDFYGKLSVKFFRYKDI